MFTNFTVFLMTASALLRQQCKISGMFCASGSWLLPWKLREKTPSWWTLLMVSFKPRWKTTLMRDTLLVTINTWWKICFARDTLMVTLTDERTPSWDPCWLPWTPNKRSASPETPLFVTLCPWWKTTYIRDTPLGDLAPLMKDHLHETHPSWLPHAPDERSPA